MIGLSIAKETIFCGLLVLCKIVFLSSANLRVTLACGLHNRAYLRKKYCMKGGTKYFFSMGKVFR